MEKNPKVERGKDADDLRTIEYQLSEGVQMVLGGNKKSIRLLKIL
jgi:hypothetical protein